MWEYKVVGVYAPEVTEKLMNDLGREGWELVTVIPGRSYSSHDIKWSGLALNGATVIFKRRNPYYDWVTVTEGIRRSYELAKIGDVLCRCSCGWVGTVYDCDPNIDGSGNLSCPDCHLVVKANIPPRSITEKARRWLREMLMTGKQIIGAGK